MSKEERLLDVLFGDDGITDDKGRTAVWVPSNKPDKDGVYHFICSCCESRAMFEYDEEAEGYVETLSDYCPFCGYRMKICRQAFSKEE